MRIERDAGVTQSLRLLFDGGRLGGLSDEQLLALVANGRDGSPERAFAVLVERHGAMVDRACRAILRDPHDAQDAFQAVFLVLARRAGSIWVRGSLSPWLHAVAVRVARGARAADARRRRHERSYAERLRPARPTADDDQGRLVHEEIGRLPERFRIPVVLCDLQGLTHEEASLQLGWPLGTVKSRQARGRERLRGRLERRGVAGSIMAATLKPPAMAAGLPPGLAGATAGTSLSTANGAASGVAAVLAKNTLRTMTMSRWIKTAGAVALLVGAGTAGLALRAGGVAAPQAEPAAQSTRPGARKDIPRVDVYQGRDELRLSPRRDRRRPNTRPDAEQVPVPESIPVTVSGRAIDTANQPVVGATVYLLKGSFDPAVLAETTTDASGGYQFEQVQVPVKDRTAEGVPNLPERAPYAPFQVIAMAPGYGLTWHQADSMYAVPEPSPLDIQGRRPFGEPITMDLTFRPADALRGRIVDEKGGPVEGVEVSILDVDLLNYDGLETSRTLNLPWPIMPGGLGRVATDSEGRFQIDGLPSEACFWLRLNRPEFPNYGDAFYAATTQKPPGTHPAPLVHTGRGAHKFEAGDFTRTFPTPRRLSVRVVDASTGAPVAGVRVSSLGEALATGVHSVATSDEQGQLVLSLPPGEYGGVCGDPPISTNYIRTYRRDLEVADEPAEQPYELRMQRGFELLLDVVDAETGRGVADVQFRLVPEDEAEKESGIDRPIQASTFGGAPSKTDESGRMRAVLQPVPGRTYRVEVARIVPPNHPDFSFTPGGESPRFIADPPRSVPFAIEAGQSMGLRFRLTMEGE